MWSWPGAFQPFTSACEAIPRCCERRRIQKSFKMSRFRLGARSVRQDFHGILSPDRPISGSGDHQSCFHVMHGLGKLFLDVLERFQPFAGVCEAIPSSCERRRAGKCSKMLRFRLGARSIRQDFHGIFLYIESISASGDRQNCF